MGETGYFDGGDIIDIIVGQPATARFVSRHLHNFFVADEPQVPAWNQVPPQDPQAIDSLTQAYLDSGAEIRPVLRVLFNSDFFKPESTEGRPWGQPLKKLEGAPLNLG